MYICIYVLMFKFVDATSLSWFDISTNNNKAVSCKYDYEMLRTT